ncbi:MAG: hypothetical protein NVS3B21_28030 [Acidimicrobiales bacterium]
MIFRKRHNDGGTMKMQAVFNGAVIAESDDTVVVEGNHYFPSDSLREEFFSASPTHTTCAWKGTASYYSVNVAGKVGRDVAWYYPNPTPMAAQVKDRVSFWHGVRVQPAPEQTKSIAPPTFDAPEGATC